MSKSILRTFFTDWFFIFFVIAYIVRMIPFHDYFFLLWNRYFTRFRYCMYAPRVRVCRPFSDGLSSIHHLLGHPILKKSVWAVSLFTCVGNLLVIVWRSISSKEDEVLSLFVQNLSGKEASSYYYSSAFLFDLLNTFVLNLNDFPWLSGSYLYLHRHHKELNYALSYSWGDYLYPVVNPLSLYAHQFLLSFVERL